MTTRKWRTLYGLQFHRNCLANSETAEEIFGVDACYEVVGRHYRKDWGEVDEATQTRNEISLESRDGIVESRFQIENNERILVVRTGFFGSWTSVSVSGEDNPSQAPSS